MLELATTAVYVIGIIVVVYLGYKILKKKKAKQPEQ